jgi:DNA-binding response OmpR family regulator
VSSRTAPPTVLVVDDDAGIRESLCDFLEEHGYRTVQGADGREAESYLRNNPAPACILLDLMMPRLDGWAVAALMRQGVLPQTPVIVMTGAGDEWGYPTAADRVLKKPFDPQQLLTIIRTVAPLSEDQG